MSAPAVGTAMPMLEMPMLKMPVLATHGGKFHCDDVFAYVVLRLALGLGAPGGDHALLRTRKPELIEAAAGGPPDRVRMAEIMHRHGLTPAP